MKHKLQINFITPITGDEIRDIQLLFQNKYNKKLPYISVIMQDTLYRSIQIADYLTKEEETFLKGLILGYLRVNPLYTVIDKLGMSLAEDQ